MVAPNVPDRFDTSRHPANPQQALERNIGASANWWLTGLVLLFLGALAIAFGASIAADEWWIPGMFILASGAALIAPMRRALRSGATVVLSDHLLLLSATFILYNVVGASLIPFGPQYLADDAMSYYEIDALLGLKVVAINCIGMGLALLAGGAVNRTWAQKTSRTAIELGRTFPQEWVIVAFLFVGALATFYVTWYDLGLNDGVVPGILRTISQLALVAIMLSAAHNGRGKNWLLAAAIALTALLAITGLLLLNKSAVLMPMLALAAGLVSRIGLRRVLLPSILVLTFVFLLIGNPINQGRLSTDGEQRINWNERNASVIGGLFNPAEHTSGEKYNAWARLCYTPPQGAAIEFYDRGDGGNDFELLAWAFVPRFLNEDKPVMTASGREFNYKISGSESSSTGQGVFVNGYYNRGWVGVVVVGLAVGVILAWTSSMAAEIFQKRAYVWLPVALLGSLMAFRIDGHFLADYWGPFVLMGYAVLAGSALTMLRDRNRLIT
jgi:MFS family permease